MLTVTAHLTDKVANAVLFFLNECPTRPGLTVLLKLLFRADFEHYREHLKSITGVRYIALERGPVPDDYKDLMRALVARRYVDPEPMDIGAAKPKECFVPLRKFDPDAFEPTEIAILRSVVQDHGHKDGVTLSGEVHEEIPWRAVWRDGEGEASPIPYALARWEDNRCTSADLEAAAGDVKAPDVQRAIAEITAAAE